MVLLEKNKYFKAAEALKEVAINNLFAKSVVENEVDGDVYVDDQDESKTFYVVHPYGMSLLFGNPDNKEFNSSFLNYVLKIRDKNEWLQAYPESWNPVLSELFGDHLIQSKDNIEGITGKKVEENTRVNFNFNKEKYLEFRGKVDLKDHEIVRTDKKMYETMQGSVVPKFFWKSADHFDKHGAGFSLILENNIASTAFAAFIHDNELEMGIETLAEHKGKGLALLTCSALIDYCMANNYDPVWSCRLENIGSYKLAQKLGFDPSFYIPYYRLMASLK